MPAQKRSYEASPTEDKDDPLQRSHNHREEEAENGEDSDQIPESSGGDKEEYVQVKLSEIRKEVQCPICLGIIRKTRTVMECLHRFCRQCIDKSMRLGNNECPACRTHCASRRSLRDDPNYDALISALYPDIDKYEEEELAFHEEEKARNNLIQASIAQTFRRQTEALGRKRMTPRSAFIRRPHSNNRNLRGRRSYRASEHQGSDDDDEDANGLDGGKYSSSADEPSMEVKPKRYKRWGGARFSQPSSAAASVDGAADEDDSEVNKEFVGVSAGFIGSSEMFTWGKGGIRSHNRHGSLSGGIGKHGRNSRLSKLIDSFRNSEEYDGLDIHVVLVSVNEEKIPSLQRPYLCCRQTLSVRHLCQFVALQTDMQADKVEMLVAKKLHHEPRPSTDSLAKFKIIDLCKDELHVLEERETLAGLQSTHKLNHPHLVLAYRLKSSELRTS